MSDVSEAPSNALASDNKAKKHRKTKSKFSKFQSAIADIKEALIQICGRLDRLERPIAQPRATRRIPTPDPGSMSSQGPQPALPTSPQPPGPIDMTLRKDPMTEKARLDLQRMAPGTHASSGAKGSKKVPEIIMEKQGCSFKPEPASKDIIKMPSDVQLLPPAAKIPKH
ncbi:hypothetical protein MRX96_036713 [Rhipicephalus microplus]